jgi:AAA domain-containing protein
MAAKNYDHIARAKIRKPSQIERAPRILVYSRNKKGKTTFGNTAPNVLILDPENGTDELKKSNPDVWPIEQWTDLEEAYQFLKGSKEARKYEWVSCDGLTRMSNMSLRFVMRMEEERNLDRRPGFVEQRDYGKAGELLKGMMLNFQTLSQGVVYTAQERVIDAADNASDDEDAENAAAMFVPDLPKGVRASVNSIVDVIGRLYVVPGIKKVRRAGEIVEKPYRQRRLWLEEHAQYDTGYRSEYDLPQYLKNPTVPRLVELMRTGEVSGRQSR